MFLFYVFNVFHVSYYFMLFELTAFGPQHPASHGVLSCVLYLSNEYLLFIDVQIGFLHSGTENLLEYKSCSQSVPYFDSLDYVSVLHNEHMFVMSFELLSMSVIIYRVSMLSILLLEVTSVFNGLLANSCAVFDLGALSPLLWAFEESEKIMLFFDWISGVSMHVAYICIGGVLDDLSFFILDYISILLVSVILFLELVDVVVICNSLLYLSLSGLALLEMDDSCILGLSGIMISCVGFLWDLSICCSYELYSIFSMSICMTNVGDAYDSLLISIYDMNMSCLLMRDVMPFLGMLLLGDIYCVDMSIENLIYLFGGLLFISVYGLSVISVEASNGEYAVILGIYFLWSSISIRCADYISVLLLDILCNGLMLSDLVALIGNIDIVFGSVDS